MGLCSTFEYRSHMMRSFPLKNIQSLMNLSISKELLANNESNSLLTVTNYQAGTSNNNKAYEFGRKKGKGERRVVVIMTIFSE